MFDPERVGWGGMQQLPHIRSACRGGRGAACSAGLTPGRARRAWLQFWLPQVSRSLSVSSDGALMASWLESCMKRRWPPRGEERCLLAVSPPA